MPIELAAPPIDYDLIERCTKESKIQSLALLYVVYYTTLSNKFVDIFNYIFNIGIHAAPVDTDLSKFQLQMFCVLCVEGKLDDIKILIEYSQLVNTRLSDFMGASVLPNFFIGFISLTEQTYAFKPSNFKTFPLVHAIVNKQFHVVKYLLEQGAVPYNSDKYGRIALHYALEMSDIGIILVVLHHMPTYASYNGPHERYINTIDEDGNTCLDIWLSNSLCVFNPDGTPNNILTALINLGAETSNDLELIDEAGQFIIEEFSDNEVNPNYNP